MLDILFVKPNSKKINYQELDEFKMTAVEPPFFALLLASFLSEQEISCDIFDEEVDKNINDNDYQSPILTVITVCGQNPSASTMSMVNIEITINKIKKKYPKTYIMLHGLHPSCFPRETLEEYQNVDFVCEGEGFLTILQTILILKNLHLRYKLYDNSIDGLWVKGSTWTPNQPNLLEFRDLPTVDLAYIYQGDYRAHNWHCFGNVQERNPYSILYTSLGCPYKCDFCCIHTMFGKKSGIRFRPIEDIKIDIDNLASRKIKNVKIMDELFTLKKDRVNEICDYIIEKKYNFNFWAYARAENITSDLARKMKNAGINFLGFGFESGSQVVLNSSNKKQKLKSILESVNICKQSEISIGANFIFGLPEDDMNTMNETLNLALTINAEWANFYSCMAYPGSKLYDDAQKLPWYQKPKTWSAYSQYSYDCQPMGTRYLSPRDVLEFRDNAFNTYFTNKNYLDMIEQKFGIKTREHIEDMTKIKVKRQLLGD